MMLVLLIAREVAALYLVFTLATTGLAKAKSWRSTSIGVSSERVVPRGLAVPLTISLVIVEVLLATLIASRVAPEAVGLAVAGLFVAFGIYKVAVGLRHGMSGCSCAGVKMSYIATPSGVAATVLASVLQATLGCFYAFVPPSAGGLLGTLPALGLILPLVAFVKGLSRAVEKRPAMEEIT